MVDFPGSIEMAETEANSTMRKSTQINTYFTIYYLPPKIENTNHCLESIAKHNN